MYHGEKTIECDEKITPEQDTRTTTATLRQLQDTSLLPREDAMREREREREREGGGVGGSEKERERERERER